MRSTREILKDVDDGIETFKLIESLKEQLKAIESRLIQDGLDRPDEHQPLLDKKREGRQFIVQGSDVCVPVIFTADKVIKSRLTESVDLNRAQELAGGLFARFYAVKQTHVMLPKDGKAFRALAGELLGKEKGPQFVSSCLDRDKEGIPKNDSKVEWKRGIGDAAMRPDPALEAAA